MGLETRARCLSLRTGLKIFFKTLKHVEIISLCFKFNKCKANLWGVSKLHDGLVISTCLL